MAGKTKCCYIERKEDDVPYTTTEGNIEYDNVMYEEVT